MEDRRSREEGALAPALNSCIRNTPARTKKGYGLPGCEEKGVRRRM